ncbi:MAG TPA: TIGR03086 family metal-binding protein [Actinomycetota bacterium]|nr:TIGR03086 family metal-binding protein [Actinomycetota bacterium]
MTDVKDLFRRSVEGFGERVHAVGDDQWNAPTPCTDWDVRTLVNHIVYEEKWAPPLLEGKTIEEIGGDSFLGDLLGSDPKQAWKEASTNAVEAGLDPKVENTTVHLSFGDFSGPDYLGQLITDHVIHAWDLARGTGGDDKLDPELVEYVYGLMQIQAEAWRASGAFANEVQVPNDADTQTKLLALTGRAS